MDRYYEKEMKQILDEFNVEEADRLTADINGFGNAGLDAERIKKTVYEKTGVKKAVVIPWKLISQIAGIAACFVIVFVGGFMLGGMGRNSDNQTGNNSDMNLASNNEDTEEIYVTFSPAEDDNVIQGNTDDEENKDNKKDKDKKPDKNKPNKSGRPSDNPSVDSNIVIGTNEYERYLDMASESVERLLEEATDEIDIEAEYDSYESLEDMESDVDCIVRGVKGDSFFAKGDGKKTFILGSEFEVNKVFVNNMNKDVKSTIKVNEGIIYNIKRECYTHVGGYARMKMGNEYILFLKKSGTSYDIAGVVYGKVPVNSSEDTLYLDGDFIPTDNVNHINSIIEFARKTYTDSSYLDENNSSDKSNKAGKSDKSDKSDKSEGDSYDTENTDIPAAEESEKPQSSSPAGNSRALVTDND